MARMSTPHDDDDESTLALAAAGKCLSWLVWLHVLLSGSPRLHVLLACISGSSLLALDTSVAFCLDVQQLENSIMMQRTNPCSEFVAILKLKSETGTVSHWKHRRCWPDS